LREKEIDIPLRRFASPAEIAASAVFLASAGAAFYCGEVLSPNGGALMR
jgi:3-oxoacyl-[acyl-carrier protein] reductase